MYIDIIYGDLAIKVKLLIYYSEKNYIEMRTSKALFDNVKRKLENPFKMTKMVGPKRS